MTHRSLNDLIAKIEDRYARAPRWKKIYWGCWYLASESRRWIKRTIRLTSVRMRLQRSRRGYSSEDLWSFDTYIAGVIGHALIQLADTTHGYPMNMTEEEWDTFLRHHGAILISYSDDKFDGGGELYDRTITSMHAVSEMFGALWD